MVDLRLLDACRSALQEIFGFSNTEGVPKLEEGHYTFVDWAFEKLRFLLDLVVGRSQLRAAPEVVGMVL